MTCFPSGKNIIGYFISELPPNSISQSKNSGPNQIKMRNKVERKYGVKKRRFPALAIE